MDDLLKKATEKTTDKAQSRQVSMLGNILRHIDFDENLDPLKEKMIKVFSTLTKKSEPNIVRLYSIHYTAIGHLYSGTEIPELFSYTFPICFHQM